MRVLRTPLGGLFLVGMVVAIAVIALAYGGTPARADTPTATATATPTPETRYECYGITGTAPAATPVNLRTSLGTETDLGIGVPSALCLPAGKNSPAIPDVPHLKCYTLVVPTPGPATPTPGAGTPTATPTVPISVMTEFGIENNIPIGQPKELCVPVGKAIAPDPAPTPAAIPYYKCYDIAVPTPGPTTPTATPIATVDLKTQFGIETGVAVGARVRLCKPALKSDVVGPGTPGPGTPTPTPEGSLNAVGLKCYTIAGDPPDKIVNLLTKFGLENEVTVSAPTRLCVPVRGTGGIAELPSLAGASGEQAGASAGGSGWSAGAYAALAGGLAAAAIVIAGGGWYARRRLLK